MMYELLDAISMGNHDKIRQLMKKLENPNLLEEGRILLCEVFERAEVAPPESLDTLVEMGVDLNAKIVYFEERRNLFTTPLNCLVERMVVLWTMEDERLEKLWKLFERSIELGADPSYPTLSLYGEAVRYGYMELIQRLYEVGANPDTLALAKVPVPTITLSRNTKIARLLENMGANPMAKDFLGRGPLFSLMDTFGRTRAINDDYMAPISVVKWFVKKGADPHEVLEGDITVMHIAAHGGNAKALKYFASLGLDPSRRDAEGKAPIHWAASNYSLTWRKSLLKVFDVLVELGVSLNEPDAEGNPPLHIAVREGAYETVLHLLNLGADPDIRDSQGMTLWDILAQQGKAFRSGRIVNIDDGIPQRIRDIDQALSSLHETLDDVGLSLPTRKALVLYPDLNASPGLMKVGGIPPGIDRDRWPVARKEVFMAILEEEGIKRREKWWDKWKKKFSDYPENVLPMEHFLTLELRPLGYLPEDLPEGTVAVSIFFPLVKSNLKEYLAWDSEELETSEFYALVPLSEEDIERGPLLSEEEVPRYSGSKPPYALTFREVEVPLVLQEFFYMENYDSFILNGDENTLREIAPSLIDILLSMSGEDRLKVIRAIYNLEQALVQASFVGGIPIYTQENEGDPLNKFIAQLGDDITEYGDLIWSNFGWALVYVFTHRMFAQRY